MSFARERNEANCLNCDTEVIGRYCHVCGQENVEPRESFWSLFTHFFNDITHFHGKFFTTLRLLVQRPGFLAAEYMRGRRARYLHPIRMYVFTSAVFFLIFYSYAGNMIEGRSSIGDVDVDFGSGFVRPDTVNVTSVRDSFTTVQQYDSLQHLLPADQRDGFLKSLMVRRALTVSKRYEGNAGGFINELWTGFIHSFPTLLFVSLPIFALLLKMLYRRRNFLYADHAIFLIYQYIFMFLFVLVLMGIDQLDNFNGLRWLRYVNYLLVIFGLYYSLAGMKHFYGQGWTKTVIKYSIFNILAAFISIVLFLLFLLLTLFRV